MIALQLGYAWLMMGMLLVPWGTSKVLAHWTGRRWVIVCGAGISLALAVWMFWVCTDALEQHFCARKLGHACSVEEIEEMQADADAAREVEAP